MSSDSSGATHSVGEDIRQELAHARSRALTHAHQFDALMDDVKRLEQLHEVVALSPEERRQRMYVVT